jgi:hypothetical protein
VHRGEVNTQRRAEVNYIDKTNQLPDIIVCAVHAHFLTICSTITCINKTLGAEMELLPCPPVASHSCCDASDGQVAVIAEEMFIVMKQSFTVVTEAANWWQDHRVQ